MKVEIFKHIELLYNIKRRYSILNYVTFEEHNNKINHKMYLNLVCSFNMHIHDIFDNFYEIAGKQPTTWNVFIEKHKVELDY